jgi:signal recognition particle subunit SRP54
MAERTFTLDDMLRQFRQIRKMGSVKDVFAMIPGMPEPVQGAEQCERNFARFEAILASMTDEERGNPDLFKDEPVRRSYVAERAGVSVEKVAELLRQYREMRQLMV